MQGWISLHRKLLVSDIFQNEKLLKVFIYCVLKASHSEHPQKIGRQTILLKPGQFIYGRKKAAMELSMNESTVRDYMDILKKDETITMKSTNKFSVVTIVNWEFYQDKEKETDNKSDSKKTPEGQQKDTNNNGNNDNNDNKHRKPVYDDDSLYFKMASYFYKLILRNNPEHREPNYQTWADDFRKLVELDNKNKDQVRMVMEWVQSDDFEMANVLSPAKLRKRYDDLYMKMNREKGKQIPSKPRGKTPEQLEHEQMLKEMEGVH